MVDFPGIQKKWQDKWQESGVFKSKEDKAKPKYYVLEMYPYPSGSGLHMGHARNYSIGDSIARYKRMRGFNVLYPMGYDSFGLPAENAAIKAKSHPRIFTEKAIENFIRQQKELGLSYDWDRTLACHKPDYYRWDQWFFLKMLEKGMAYKKKSKVNFCTKCDTVLANEQVVNGACWRHEDSEVELRELEQWFFKTTDYAQELLDGIDKLDWSEDVKQMQRNWIGRSEGVNISFKLSDSDEVLHAYTTRCDTIFSATFIVIAPEHPSVPKMVMGTKYEKETLALIDRIRHQTEMERTTPEGKDKIGCFLGKYAINPVNREKIPVYMANFVMMYGTGIVMADAHDQRDFEFARKYDIPLKMVISKDGSPIDVAKSTQAHTDDGILYDSGDFSGMHNLEALPKIADWLVKKSWAEKTINFKLRDWLISRQRFWGAPIPIIYCDKCGAVPVPEKDLPVKLPDDIKFSGKGNPLLQDKSFIDVKCPKCSSSARRETDTMDTFVDSSWYFLRYTDSKNDKAMFDRQKADYWCPIDQYIGGKEHATGHLIYFRFVTKVLRDMGMLSFDEPATKMFNQGMLHKNGVVMSKSKGNVVLPEEISEKYGIDTARLFLLFVSHPGKDMEWNDEGIEGSYRFIKKLHATVTEKAIGKTDKKELSYLNLTVRNVTAYFESFEMNKAIIELMQFTKYLSERETVSKESVSALLRMMSPFTPHICEELWEYSGGKGMVSIAPWPSFDESLIDESVMAADELIERTRKDILSVMKLTGIKPKKITVIVSEEWKYAYFGELKELLTKTRDGSQIIKQLMSGGLKRYGADIAKMTLKFTADQSKLPKYVGDQKSEMQSIKDAISTLEKEFSSKISVIKAEDAKEKKQSLPGKPAIILD